MHAAGVEGCCWQVRTYCARIRRRRRRLLGGENILHVDKEEEAVGR